MKRRAPNSRPILAAIAVAGAFACAACEGLIGANFDRPGNTDGGGNANGIDMFADGASSGSLGGEGGSNGGDGSNGAGSDGGSGGGIDGSTTESDGGGGRTPQAIFGGSMSLWLVSTKGVLANGNQQLLTWTDQSASAAQGSPFGAGGGDLEVKPMEVNGFPGIEIDSDALTLDKSPNIGMTDDFYIGMVARYTLLGSNDRFMMSRLSSFGRGYAFYAGRDSNPATAATLDTSGGIQSSTVANTADGKYRVYALRRSAGSNGNAKLDIRVNGVSTTIEVPYAAPPTDRPLIFGAAQQSNGQVAQFMIGAFAEIVVVQGTTQDADITELETSLMSKYNLH